VEAEQEAGSTPFGIQLMVTWTVGVGLGSLTHL
jgi:hypothetical protein